MAIIPQFSAAQLESISKVLADTSTGLTGTELSNILQQCNIEDCDVTNTKWKRLYNAFVNKQSADKCGNNIVRFVQEAMSPSRHINNQARYDEMRSSLNIALSLCGYKMNEDGRLSIVQASRTIEEAKSKADRLLVELAKRNVHPEVMNYCQARFVEKDYFYAVLEASKSIALG